MAGITLRAAPIRQETDVSVVGVRRPEVGLTFNPPSDLAPQPDYFLTYLFDVAADVAANFYLRLHELRSKIEGRRAQFILRKELRDVGIEVSRIRFDNLVFFFDAKR